MNLNSTWTPGRNREEKWLKTWKSLFLSRFNAIQRIWRDNKLLKIRSHLERILVFGNLCCYHMLYMIKFEHRIWYQLSSFENLQESLLSADECSNKVFGCFLFISPQCLLGVHLWCWCPRKALLCCFFFCLFIWSHRLLVFAASNAALMVLICRSLNNMVVEFATKTSEPHLYSTYFSVSHRAN